MGFAVLKDGVKPAAIDRSALVDRALRVCRGLQDLGLRKGTVVVLLGEPSVPWAVTFAAVLLAGGMPVPIHARSTPAEFERVMAVSRAKFAVVSVLSSAFTADEQDRDWTTVPMERAGGGHPSIEAMFELDRAVPAACDEDEPAVVLPTSGTTGDPKLVVHTHRSHMEFLDGWTDRLMTGDDKVLGFLPLNHQGGLLIAWIAAFYLGIPYYHLSQFSVREFWDAVHTYQITWTGLIDPVPGYLLDAEPTDGDRAHSLRMVIGSRRPSQIPAMERRFGIRLMRSYGSTETTHVAMSVELNRPEVAGLTLEEFAACAGPPLPGWSFRIIQEDRAEAPPGVTGSLEVRGPWLFAYYLNNPEATAAAFTEDGWFKTGDRAYVNRHRELFFVERAGNSIRRNGENISAAEVESVLLEHPGISQVCVVGVPDARRGQEVRACVVRSPGSTVTADEIFDHCLASLSKFKVPRYIDFWDEFPRTSTFKIARRELGSDPDTWVDRYA